MSRKPTTSIRPTTTGTMPTNSTAILPSDICPVCKRVKYLDKEMEFLINPECYHAMCNTCVTSRFQTGPAQCPYAGCTKTLRQRGFRRAFFADLAVEREVDVRRRVAAVFNMEADDFQTLRDYNNYLQEVEDLTFDLVSGGDDERAQAEDRLRAHEQVHRDDIERKKKKGKEAEALRRRKDADDAEAVRLRRQEDRDREERAKVEEAKIRDEVMEALARGDRNGASAAEIQDRIVARKRATLAKMAGSHFALAGFESAGAGAGAATANSTTATTGSTAAAATGNGGGGSLLSIRGLKDKKRIAADEEEDLARPYEPFGGLDLAPTRYKLGGGRGEDEQQQQGGDDEMYGYRNPWLADAKARDDHRVPGYDTREYVARAMFEAFSGLGVAVAEEKADVLREAGTLGAVEVVGGGGGAPGS